jgi:hypothetical protein
MAAQPLAYKRGTSGVRRDAPEDKAEEQAIALLQRVVAMSEAAPDAPPGSAVRYVKLAIAIMRKRHRQEPEGAAAGHRAGRILVSP